MHRRITIDPAICSGKPVIANTRVLVANILADLADGLDYDQIILNYPNIKKEDIVACLEFGSELAKFETVGIDRAV
jgi:uncharacterized protein (DUF433 family)